MQRCPQVLLVSAPCLAQGHTAEAAKHHGKAGCGLLPPLLRGLLAEILERARLKAVQVYKKWGEKPTTLGKLAVGRSLNVLPAKGLSRTETAVAQGCLGRSRGHFSGAE